MQGTHGERPEIKTISVKREKRSDSGQQAREMKKRKIDWTEIEAIAAWIGLGFMMGLLYQQYSASGRWGGYDG